MKAGISNRDIYHVAEFTVGSNKQKVSVRLDTLLNALWFPAPSCGELESDELDRRDTRKDYLTCDSKGTFSLNTLTTFRRSNELFEILFTTNQISGYFGTDDVTLGDNTTKMEFGVATEATMIGWLGLGFPYDPQEENFTRFSEILVEKRFSLETHIRYLWVQTMPLKGSSYSAQWTIASIMEPFRRYKWLISALFSEP